MEWSLWTRDLEEDILPTCRELGIALVPYSPLGRGKGCSLNQLALAWVLHNGNDVVLIPGTTKKVNLESNIGAVAISLSKEEIKDIEGTVPVSEVAGDRYHEDIGLKESWRHSKTPPLSSWKGSKVA
ncbi:hypothetical protein BDL97_10G004200 [Sphagnum fallax]|nr:hypothetical protein BDL97_10G004200 [Sphagnum fallax]